MTAESPPGDDGLGEAVRTRRERRALWSHTGERSLSQNLALVGALGWTIVVPILLGILGGRWLDRHFASGVFWTLGLLTAGCALGCVLAWRRIRAA